MGLKHILRDIDVCIRQYEIYNDKELYKDLRKQVINLNNLKKGEYTYYYAMARERTIPNKTW